MCTSKCATCSSATTCLTCANQRKTLASNCDSCEALYTGSTCGSCISLADQDATTKVCACTENSSYNSTNDRCECNSGYQEAAGKCVEQRPYFDPATDTIKVQTNENFTQIVVQFPQDVADAVLKYGCSELFPSTISALFGTNYYCYWSNRKQLHVNLGSNFTATSGSTISLNAYNIWKKNGTSSFNYKALSYSLTYKNQPVAPKVNIWSSVNNKYSLACNNSNLQLLSVGSNFGSGISGTYQWTITSPNNQNQINNLNRTQSSLVIPRNLLSAGQLTVKLTVTNNLNLNSEQTLIIDVSDESSISVQISTPNQLLQQRSDRIRVKAYVDNICSDQNFTTSFSWSLVSCTGNDNYTFQNQSNRSYILLLNPNTLAAGSSCTFRVSAEQGDSTDVNDVTVTVEHSKLVVNLNRSDSEWSKSSDLSISAAGSYDPDSSSTALTYSWSCYSITSSTQCVDTDG